MPAQVATILAQGRDALAWPRCYLEQIGPFGQLRILLNRRRFHVDLTKADIPIEIDTRAGLQYIRSQIEQNLQINIIFCPC